MFVVGCFFFCLTGGLVYLPRVVYGRTSYQARPDRQRNRQQSMLQQLKQQKKHNKPKKSLETDINAFAKEKKRQQKSTHTQKQSQEKRAVAV